ncbi:MAG: hypothetical protein CM1200mP2_25190 [Planctomycetaceae bacterium]|nr:MAG: hypothetical protein CM1200mP2_25190 [Planctomycetaceae bacterium]
MSSAAIETVPRFRRGGWMFLLRPRFLLSRSCSGPLIHGVALGFFDVQLRETRFIGLENYID